MSKKHAYMYACRTLFNYGNKMQGEKRGMLNNNYYSFISEVYSAETDNKTIFDSFDSFK